MTKVIGLTGGIASGKSTIARMFEEEGIPLIDTDVIAKHVLDKDTPGYYEVLEVFGEDILHSSKDINRKKLGKIIFESQEKREILNAIVHPKVISIAQHEINRLIALDTPMVVVDVPLLYEVGFEKHVDYVVVVSTSRDLQVARLMDRDLIDEDYALTKVQAQMPLTEKEKKADFIIDNSLSILHTKKEFNRVIEAIKER
jgi:dephospho-CoA kinase